MKPRFVRTCLAFLSLCLAGANWSTGDDQPRNMGLSVAQLRTLVDSLPQLPGSIQAIQFLRKDVFWINRAAVLTQGQNSGWQICILNLEDTGKFKVEWESGKLDDSFAGSSVDQFQVYTLSEEQVLRFSGCAAHNCPDVFSVLLYVPSKNTAFTATYTLGKVTYSPSSGGPMFRYYKMELDRLIAEHRRIKD